MLCETCVYAKWEMTNHKKPKINKNKYGVCNYKVDKDKVKTHLNNIFPEINIKYDIDNILNTLCHSKVLWVHYDIDECHFYKQMEEE